jgi:ABC-type glutathione transport system ATPase component
MYVSFSSTLIFFTDEVLSVVDPLSLGGAVEEEDDDVMDERRKVERGQVTKEEVAVMIKNLRKIFKGKTGEKVAVDDLCLTMARNECFGLLGPNGF